MDFMKLLSFVFTIAFIVIIYFIIIFCQMPLAFFLKVIIMIANDS